MTDLHDKEEWPTISQAVNSQSPLQIAILSGAKKIGDNLWLYKGRKVTEQFLENYFHKKL